MAPKPDAVPVVSPAAPPASFAGVLVRLYWIAFGNIGVLVGFFKSAQARELGAADVVYWGFGASLIAARYLDIACFQGRTSEGRPATRADWYRYAVGAVLVLAALWAVARLVAPLRV